MIGFMSFISVYVFYYWFYIFISSFMCCSIGFMFVFMGCSWVNLRKIQKEAAGPGPGRTWAGPGRARRLFLDFSIFELVFVLPNR